MSLRQLMERAKDQCHFCGGLCRKIVTKGELYMKATIDHLTPKSRGGGRERANCALACHSCNNLKGDMTEEEFEYFRMYKEFAPTYVKHLESVRVAVMKKTRLEH